MILDILQITSALETLTEHVGELSAYKSTREMGEAAQPLAAMSDAELGAAMLAATYPTSPLAIPGSGFAQKVLEEAANKGSQGGFDSGFDSGSALPLLCPALPPKFRSGLPRRLSEIEHFLSSTAFRRGLKKIDGARSAPELAEASRRAFALEANKAKGTKTKRRIAPPLVWRARFLMAAGRSCFPPSDRLLRTLERLGWLKHISVGKPKNGSRFDESTRLAAMSLAERLGRSTGHPPGEIALLLGALSGETFGPPAEETVSLCKGEPKCAVCPLRKCCLFGKMRHGGSDQKMLMVQPFPSSKKSKLDTARAVTPAPDKVSQANPRTWNSISCDDHTKSDAELLAILLGGGQPHPRLEANIEEILRRAGGLTGLAQLSPDSPLLEEGLSKNRRAIWEAARAIAQRLAVPSFGRGHKIGHAADVYRAFHPRLRLERQEFFIALLLNTKNHLLQEVELARGTLDATVIHPRDAFRPALVASAAGVIFLHNHPSGDPTPSHADRDATRQLREVGRILRIPMLDHIIIGDGAYFSFHDDELVKMHSGSQRNSALDENIDAA